MLGCNGTGQILRYDETRKVVFLRWRTWSLHRLLVVLDAGVAWFRLRARVFRLLSVSAQRDPGRTELARGQ